MNWRISDYPCWQVTCVILGSLLGGTLSILSGLKKYKFEENLNWIYHLMLGIERVFLSCVAGGIAYITLKSEMLFPHVDMNNYWGVLLIVAIAGFSEAFIPSALDKALNKISKENEEKPKS